MKFSQKEVVPSRRLNLRSTGVIACIIIMGLVLLLDAGRAGRILRADTLVNKRTIIIRSLIHDIHSIGLSRFQSNRPVDLKSASNHESVRQCQTLVDIQRKSSVFTRNEKLSKFHSHKKNTTGRPAPLIIMWTIRDYKHRIDSLWNEKKLFKNCAYSNCKYTYDRSKLPEASLIFLFFDGHRPFPIPEVNWSKQVTIFQTQESENWYSNQFENEDHIFNYSMTYKTNSDIVYNYDCERSYFSGENLSLPETAFKRKKVALWYVSNCNPQERLQYGRKLSNHISVDIYGWCGKGSDGCNSAECTDKLFKQYQFYLAFENSRCTDYITEKVYKVYEHFVIPVVMGTRREDYEAVLPPGSFIHVDDFHSPLDLAAHMTRVMNDRDLFMSYHAWRYTNFRFPTVCTSRLDTCELCRLANEKPKRQLKMSEFWNNRKNCRLNE